MNTDDPTAQPITYGRGDDFLYDPTLINTDGELIAAVAAWTLPLVALAHPRTRGAGTLALAVLLSRAHSHARHRLEAMICGLFAERTSVGARVDVLEREHAAGHVEALAARVSAISACFGGDPLAWQHGDVADYRGVAVAHSHLQPGAIDLPDGVGAGVAARIPTDGWPDADNDSGASG